jgi:hypothetical protein
VQNRHHGQVAQLVEQGTENPRVGGSIPSLATSRASASAGAPVLLASRSLLAATVALGTLLAGCQADSCDTLCVRTASSLSRCIQTWEPVDWEMLDAENQSSFQEACESRWSEVRSLLESRELEDALQQCDEALTAIDEMGEDGTTCDQLRALYIE